MHTDVFTANALLPIRAFRGSTASLALTHKYTNGFSKKQTLMRAQDTLEDSGGSELLPSFHAASPTHTQPPLNPAFAPSLPMAPSHLVAAPPSDWSIASTLPSSSPHPDYVAPSGPMPPQPNVFGSPRASMQYAPAATPSFPPAQPPLPGVYHSSPRGSTHFGGEVNGLGLGSQQLMGGLNGLRASSLRNSIAGPFAAGTDGMQDLPHPPLPSRLAAPPAAMPIQVCVCVCACVCARWLEYTPLHCFGSNAGYDVRGRTGAFVEKQCRRGGIGVKGAAHACPACHDGCIMGGCWP
eukprot:1160954-Pelagomonas_calceolata.AAC.10